jgi:hypothetical protein
VGIPYYGRRWTNATQALQTSNFNRATSFFYRDLVTDATRWQSQYKFYDSIYGANYLSINTPNLKEFDSYTDTQFLNDAVAWQQSQSFGGFMTYTIEYEHLSTQTCDAAFPLTATLYNAANFTSQSSILTVLSATAGNTQVSLSWSACAGAVTYNLYRSSGSKGPYVTLATGLTAAAYTDTAVTNGSIYYYYVASLNSSGIPAGSSNQVSATPADVSNLPLAPSNLTATSPSKKRIKISWTAPSDATSSTTYKIYRSIVSGGPYKYIDTTSNTSYLNLGMGSGITYYYVVTAVNAAGVESSYSNQAYATAK